MTILTLREDVTVSVATGGRPIDDGAASDPVVLLLHGAGMDRTAWSLQTRWLAHHGCPTIAIDLPGHGASTEPERSSITDYAEWAANVITVLDRPVHLVGHSMGSFIALECSRLVELASLTLIGTAAAMPVHPALLDAAAANDPLAGQLMSGWAFAPATRTGPHPAPGTSMVGTTQAMIAQSRPGVLSNDLAMCAAYADAVETAAMVTVPGSFLLGPAEKMTPVRAAQLLVDAIAHAHVQIVPGVGHMVQVEAPAVTRTAIARSVGVHV